MIIQILLSDGVETFCRTFFFLYEQYEKFASGLHRFRLRKATLPAFLLSSSLTVERIG